MSAVHAEGLCSSTSEIIFTSIFSRKSLWLKSYDKCVNVFLLLLFLFYNQSNRKKSKNLKKTYFWNTLDLND